MPVRIILGACLFLSLRLLSFAQSWQWQDTDLRNQIVFHWTSEFSLHNLEKISFPSRFPSTEERKFQTYNSRGTAFHQLFPQFKQRGSFFVWTSPTAIRANPSEMWARSIEGSPARLIALQFIGDRPIRFLKVESDYQSVDKNFLPDDLIHQADVVLHKSFEWGDPQVVLQEMVILNPQVIARHTANPRSLKLLFELYRSKHRYNQWRDFESSVAPLQFNASLQSREVFAAFYSAETPMSESFPLSFAEEWDARAPLSSADQQALRAQEKADEEDRQCAQNLLFISL